MFRRGLQRLLTPFIREDVRNIAVIAHVDHGKTTLVDAMLKQSGTIADAKNRVMDSKDQEKERGITILAKHTSILPKGQRINIVDTPGHLDFGGEVERALQMVEGFLLLVDAHEGVKPGTRYVLRKALQLKLKPIVIYNKIDMAETNIEKSTNQINDLFLDTVEDADQLEIVSLYGSGRGGYMNTTPTKGGTMQPLFETIMQVIPPPKQKEGAPLQLLVGNVDELPDGTKIAIGRIFSGEINVKDVIRVVLENVQEDALVKRIQLYKGVDKVDTQRASTGDVAVVHLAEAKGKPIPLRIGCTLCDPKNVVPRQYVKPDDPTFQIIIREMAAKWKETETKEKMKSRFSNIRDRLYREAMNNTGLRLENVEGNTNALRMLGRGLLHLGVILEDLRREDFEFELQAPDVLTRQINGETCEPFEKLTLEFKPECLSTVTTLLVSRSAEIGETNTTLNDRVVLECVMPVRTIGDLNIKFLQATKGDGVFQHEHAGYQPFASNIDTRRTTTALVAAEAGLTTDYGLSSNKQHGSFFVGTSEQVYPGQVVGDCTSQKATDMIINVTKAKEGQGGFRANAHDAAQRTKSGFTHIEKSMEDALQWVMPDELVTVTPKSVRIRKYFFDGKTTKARKGEKII